MMIRRKKYSTLFLKYLITYSLILLIPISFMTFYLYRHFFKILEDNVMENTIQSMRSISVLNDNNIKQIESILNEINLDSVFKPFYFTESPAKASKLIRKLSNFNALSEFIDEIVIYYRGDDILYSSKSSYSLDMFYRKAFVFDKVNESILHDTMENCTVMQVLPAQKLSGFAVASRDKNYVTFVYPYPMFSDKPYATILFMVSEDKYESLFKTLNQNGGSTYICDASNTVISSMRGSSLNETIINLVRETDEKETMKILEIDKERLLFVYLKSPGIGWKYINVVPADNILQPLLIEQRMVVILLGVLTAAGGLLVYLFTRLNYQPIKLLTRLVNGTVPEDTTDNNEIHSIRTAIESLCLTNTKLSRRLTESFIAQKRQLLFDLVKGEVASRDELAQRCQSLQVDFAATTYAVAILLLCPQSPGEASQKRVIPDIENNTPHGMSVLGAEEIGSNRCTFFIGISSDDLNGFVHGIQCLQKHICDHIGEYASLGVSKVFCDPGQAPRAFLEASSALDYRFVTGNGKAVFFHTIEAVDTMAFSYPYKHMEKLAKSLRQGDAVIVQNTINELMNCIQTNAMPLFLARCIYHDTYSLIIKEYCSLNKTVDGNFGSQYDIFLLAQNYSIDELSNVLRYACTELCIHRKSHSDSSGKPIDAIKKYMEEHCCDINFSIQHTADQFNMSLPKLSVLIKSETGRNPLDYITLIRINTAKELLCDTTINIKDIVFKVGYNDASSFIRKFKQTVGITPATYRKACSEDADYRKS